MPSQLSANITMLSEPVFSNISDSSDDNEPLIDKFLKKNHQKLQSSSSSDENEPLIEIIIRYSILYLEEFNYDLKLIGLNLLDHLMLNTSAAVLNLNMRSKLILTTYEKNINDKNLYLYMHRKKI